MKKQLINNFSKFILFLEKAIRGFNFAFFLVSLFLWAILTCWELLSKPFEWSLLWSAFNILYGQFSFKVSCIILIIFNGFQTVRLWIFDYYEIKEYGEHLITMKKLVSKQKNEG